MSTRFRLHNKEVLKDIITKLKSVCVNVYAGRPNATDTHMDEFLVVTIPYSVRDKGPYQDSTLRIEVVVKNKSQGVPNIGRLEELANNLISKFPLTAEDKRYKTGVPNLTITGYDGLGFTIWNLQCKLIVNTTDIYNK